LAAPSLLRTTFEKTVRFVAGSKTSFSRHVFAVVEVRVR
jgi:hypothetical protein